MARQRMLSLPRERWFVADWLDVVMIHLQVRPSALQAVVPFELDLWEGGAFVTLVAFSLRSMQPHSGGWATRLLCRPLADHEFLNVRTYVRQNDQLGIHFLAEWVNHSLAVALGPRVFSLPYRRARIEYQNDIARRITPDAADSRGALHGRVVDARSGSAVSYHAALASVDGRYSACARGSRDEWLMERYAAFNSAGGRQRSFRVWHEPWVQMPLDIALNDHGLLVENWPFLRESLLTGASHSPGVRGVWMGRPHRLEPS